MPIDPSIPLGIKPAAIQNPLEAMTAITQLQAARLRAQEQARAAADALAIRRVLQETGGDVQAALPRLRTIAPKAALELETEIAKRRKEGFEAHQAKLKSSQTSLDLGIRLLQGVTDQQTYDLVRPMIGTMAPDIAQAMGDTYDPARVQQFLQVGLTAKDLYDRRQDAMKLFTEGKANEALGTYLSTARTAEEWDGIVASAKAQGIPDAVIAPYGAFSPENVQRAATRAITPQQRATLAGQAEARAQAAAHQQVTESQGAERIRIARQRLAQGKGSDTDREALMQAVIENPGLWDQITPTERGKIAGDLNARGFTGFGKPLSDAAVKQISETKSAIASLQDLRAVLQKNEQYLGPVAGFAALNPYSEARQAQADIDRVRQRVGKALEGGVLRKEDEEKYKKILATLHDVPATAIYKVDQLMADLQRDMDTYTHQQRLQGRRVPASAPAGTSPAAPPSGRGGGGTTYEDYLRSKGGR